MQDFPLRFRQRRKRLRDLGQTQLLLLIRRQRVQQRFGEALVARRLCLTTAQAGHETVGDDRQQPGLA